MILAQASTGYDSLRDGRSTQDCCFKVDHCDSPAFWPVATDAGRQQEPAAPGVQAKADSSILPTCCSAAPHHPSTPGISFQL